MTKTLSFNLGTCNQGEIRRMVLYDESPALAVLHVSEIKAVGGGRYIATQVEQASAYVAGILAGFQGGGPFTRGMFEARGATDHETLLASYELGRSHYLEAAVA